MNLRASFAVAFIAALWVACDSLSTITIKEESTTTVEQGTVLEELIGDFGFGEFLEMQIMDTSEIKNAGVGPGDVRSVVLSHLELEATDPEGADLSFIDEIAFYVESEDLPRQRIASQTEFPEGEALVVLDIDSVELVDYAVAESMSITTEVTGSRPEVDVDVVARIELAVGVTPQGACNQIK